MVQYFTLPNINRRLKALDENLELVKGEGYFYFVYDVPGSAYETESIMVHKISHLSGPKWIEYGKTFLLGRKEFEESSK
jgi:hypothetical protein